MLEALPNIDWSAEEVKPPLNLILKRINTTFTKITDKPDLMVSLQVLLSLVMGGVLYFKLCLHDTIFHLSVYAAKNSVVKKNTFI